MLNRIITSFLIVLPWLVLPWLIGKSFDGELNGFVAILLVILLIPVIIIINALTFVALKGQVYIKQIRNAQRRAKEGDKPIESVNYSELPWWNPRRWL